MPQECSHKTHGGDQEAGVKTEMVNKSGVKWKKSNHGDRSVLDPALPPRDPLLLRRQRQRKTKMTASLKTTRRGFFAYRGR